MSQSSSSAPGKCSRALALLREHWILAVVSLALIFVALVPRLAALGRDTDSEEIRHLYIIMSSPTIRDVLRALAYQMQPAFEYLVRKVFWAPLIGQEEREARLVSVFYGISAVYLCFWAVVRYLKNIRVNEGLAAALGFSVALAIALNRSAILSSTDARHYIFVMLLSMLWLPMFCLDDAFSSRGFRWLSFIFASTHFFALFLVALACGFEIVKRLYLTRRIRAIAYPVLLGLSVLVVTVMVNRYAFKILLEFNSPKRELGEVLREVWTLFVGFWADDLSVRWALMLAALLGPMAYALRSERMLRAFLIAVPGLLFFLFYARHKSTYPWSDHYFYVFWGLVPVVAALTLEWVWRLAARVPKAAPFAMLATALPFVSISALSREMARLPSIRIPHHNFTGVYQLYARMKSEHVPIYVLYPDAFSFEIPPFYFLYVSPPYQLGFQARDTEGGNGVDEKIDIEAIAAWIRRNPEGLFYLDTRSFMCGVDGTPDLGSVRVERITSQARCDWRLENIQSVRELASTLQALKFPTSVKFRQLAEQYQP